MKDITILGIDLAKHSFQLHGLDNRGKNILKSAFSPKKADEFIANLKPCRIAMEACGGANFRARKYIAMGHDAKIIAPQFVKPFVKGNRNDPSDAEGIAEAASRPSMRFVPIKTEENQNLQNFHRIRDRLIGNKVALSNQIRGILYEYGITIAKGDNHLRKNLILLCQPESKINSLLKSQLADLYDELVDIIERADRIEKRLEKMASTYEPCQRLMDIPGVGPLIATAILSYVSNASEFKNGRQMAAWLGLVPGHRQSGGPNGKKIMLPITKRGDCYLRKLIVQGARCALITAGRKSDKTSTWVTKLKSSKGFNKAAVALANKNTRMMWALLTTGKKYKRP